MPFTESQRAELEEYLETILELYTEDEYEELVEGIVSHIASGNSGSGKKNPLNYFTRS